MKPPATFLQQVDKVLFEHLTEPDILSLLCLQLGLSKSQIYRKIKQKTGVSPSIYIRRKRLAIAHQWLQETDASISEIAAAVGFRNLSYFSRCFRVEYGDSASRIRENSE